MCVARRGAHRRPGLRQDGTYLRSNLDQTHPPLRGPLPRGDLLRGNVLGQVPSFGGVPVGRGGFRPKWALSKRHSTLPPLPQGPPARNRPTHHAQPGSIAMRMTIAHPAASSETPRPAAWPRSVWIRNNERSTPPSDANRPHSTSCKPRTRRLSAPRAVRKPRPAPSRRLTQRQRFTP